MRERRKKKKRRKNRRKRRKKKTPHGGLTILKESLEQLLSTLDLLSQKVLQTQNPQIYLLTSKCPTRS